jgi:large repetitive protein
MKIKMALALLTLLTFACPAGAAPVISSFSPVFGASNDVSYITILGSGFYPGTLVVKFNGVQDPTAAAILVNGTEIHAHVAPGTPVGAGKIFVSVNGASTFSANDFTVIGPGPFVTNFTPVIGAAGTTVTILGVHFYNGASALQVTNVSFNGIIGTGLFVVSDNQITVQAPSGVTTGPLVLRSALGTFFTSSNVLSAATNFFVPPVITGFAPFMGRPGTNVMITGSNLFGASQVTFNGTSASFTPPTNNTNLRAVVPAGATTGKIMVVAPAGSSFSTSNFLVQPTIFSFSPTSGGPGTSVTITGENLWGTTNVGFNGVKSTTVTGITYSQLTAVVPAGASTGPITVTTTNGSATSIQIFYVPPIITGFTPTNSAPGTTVTITGSNLLGTTSVSFNGAGTGFIPPTTNTTLLATVPAGVITGPISVTAPAGTATSGSRLFYGAPVVNSFSPTSGLPGTNVTILGTNFIGVTGVKFASPTVVIPNLTNNGLLTAIVPADAQTGPITVLAPGGTNASAGVFTLNTIDLSVNAIDSPDPVFAGSNLVYTITIVNNSALVALNVKFTNALPASAGLKSATTTQGSLTTNVSPIVGNLGSLGSGGSATVTLTVVPLAGGTITDSASVGCDYPDPAPANNSSSIATLVWPLPVLSILRLTNEVQVAWPAPLSNFTLQFIPALAANYYWSNLGTAPVLAGTNNIVVDPSTNPARFYRLKQ